MQRQAYYQANHQISQFRDSLNNLFCLSSTNLAFDFLIYTVHILLTYIEFFLYSIKCFENILKICFSLHLFFEFVHLLEISIYSD